MIEIHTSRFVPIEDGEQPILHGLEVEEGGVDSPHWLRVGTVPQVSCTYRMYIMYVHGT